MVQKLCLPSFAAHDDVLGSLLVAFIALILPSSLFSAPIPRFYVNMPDIRVDVLMYIRITNRYFSLVL